MTAIDTWIADLLAFQGSDAAAPLISPYADVIAALQFIAAGLAPSGPETRNTFLAGPTSGAPALPTFRAIVAGDIGATLNLAFNSLALGGAVIGAFALAVTGTTNLGGNVTGAAASSFELVNSAASNVVPTLVPNKADATTGLGAQAAGNISEIVAGAEVGRWTATGLNNAALGATTPSTAAFTTGSGTSLALGGAAIGGNAFAVTGTSIFNSGVTLGAALTYGGVTLSNAVTGTGAMVLATGAALVTPALGVATATSLAIGGAAIGGNAFAVTGTSIFNSGVTLGAALTYGGVTLSNAVTGTGAMVLATGAALVTPALGVATATSLAIGGAAIGGNALAITGTTLTSNNITISSNDQATTRLILTNTAGHSFALVAGIVGISNNGFEIFDVTGATHDLQIDNSGNLTILAASGTLITTGTSLSSNAGASAGTLTNAPSVGNPSKWIAINDNGTTRKIPTWT